MNMMIMIIMIAAVHKTQKKREKNKGEQRSCKARPKRSFAYNDQCQAMQCNKIRLQ